MHLNKIFIVGIVASGKTTLAKQLSKIRGIPWYELDCVVHNDSPIGRHKRTKEEQLSVIEEIDARGQWIFEGTDRSSYQCLYVMADWVIFMDTPLWKRRMRIFTRYCRQKIGLESCHYRSDLAMLKRMYQWTSEFEHNRAQFEAKLRQYADKVIRVTNRRDLAMLMDCFPTK